MSSELSSRANKERTVLILIPLLLLQLVLLSLQIESPSGALLFKTWTMTAQAPVVSFFSSITNGIRDIWHDYVWLVGARAENEQLQRTINRLSLLNRAYEQSRLENERLHRLISLSDRMNFQVVGARVIARTPGFLSNILYIDHGSKDGIPVDAPVLSGDGIIGRIVLVTGHQSQVQLVTNPDASMGVMLERSRTPGVIRGTGDQLLDLNYISNTEQVMVGDNVLSSGLDGIFPKGIAVGRVVDVRKGTNVFWAIKVKPMMDMIHLEEVSVLLENRTVQRP